MENPVWDDGIPMISVVGDSFCVPYGMEMVVKKKIHGFKKVHYDVYDTSGNLLLQVDGNVWKLQKKRVMRDPAGLPLLTIRYKLFKWKKEWTVSPGESSEENVLFKVEESNPLRLKTRLDVFLEDKKSDKENHSDFHVNGRFNSLSFKVYRGKSAIAQVNHHYSWGSFCKGKENFRVKVHPEVDYSFIMALLVILDEVDN
ncbi:hypothetical protein Ddye_031634 [Dipteronia dyeriana]|uniref:Protein LURP-one-related 14-like n=1 Tax=Dipteronia dyeriana TaxID=168575 RepID=A0AAD9WNN2_9ROSI|nr:hypothetical protein Ddye_031634 [Dipteronia dyeriana]